MNRSASTVTIYPTHFLSMMNYTSSASLTKPALTISMILACVPEVLVEICARLISLQRVV